MERETDVCEITYIHKEKIENVKKNFEEYYTPEVVNLFKVLSDETRLKIAYALAVEDELCVCDVANIAGISIATASHHLRLLKSLHVAKNRKEGKLVYYALSDGRIKQLLELAFLLQRGHEHAKH